MNYFKNDWIKFHYNFNLDQTQRKSRWDVFSYTIKNQSPIRHGLFLDELKFTCQEIFQKTKELNTDLGLFLSGGVDSEIIARTYVKLGIPFTCYFIKFENNLNGHEYELVCNLEKELNLKVIYLNVDIESWLAIGGEYDYYCKKYNTFDLATPLQMYARSQIDSRVSIISGLYEPHLFKYWHSQNKDHEWVHMFDESSIMSRIRFLEEHSFKDFPFFYLFRPELYAAYSNDYFVDAMVENPYKLSLVSTKKVMMRCYFPEMKERPKFTGFENLQLNTISEALSRHPQGYQDGEIRLPHKELNKVLYDRI